MIQIRNILFKKNCFQLIAFIFLMLLLLSCSKCGRQPDKILQRGTLTLELYDHKPGIGHGDGSPAHCVIVFNGQRYTKPPDVKDGGRIFRCDLKPNSEEPIVWIAYYRPNDAWECGTRFGTTRAYCLKNQYESVGGLLMVKDNKLVIEDLGYWDDSFDWIDTSLKFKDGREFNYQTRKWSGCGDEPSKTEKIGSMTVTSGKYCNRKGWCRVYFDDKEFLHPEADNHTFHYYQLNPNKDMPSVLAWIGEISSVIYLSQGKPTLKELPKYPEFVEEGKSVRWWSEDRQTRYTMNLKTEETTSQNRKEVQEETERKKQTEK